MPEQSKTASRITYRTVQIDGLDIFYREAGPRDAPAVLLLHGFPTSSHMFRNLITALADEFHLVAPDYPGFGNSSMPTVDQFDYTFDHLADVIGKFTEKVGLQKYTLYVQDYGAPVGYRLATAYPERVQALVVQNGNAYDEGIDNDFWKPLKAYWKERTVEREQPLYGFFLREATIWQYTVGVLNREAISPDNWNMDQALLDRPGHAEIQLALFYSYGSNPPLYPDRHAGRRRGRRSAGPRSGASLPAGARPRRESGIRCRCRARPPPVPRTRPRTPSPARSAPSRRSSGNRRRRSLPAGSRGRDPRARARRGAPS